MCLLVASVLALGQMRVGEKKVGEHFTALLSSSILKARHEASDLMLHAGLGEMPFLKRWLTPYPPAVPRAVEPTPTAAPDSDPEETLSSSDRESVLRLLE